MPNQKLEKYRKKRDFQRTSEPAGDADGRAGHLFMVHKHDATRLHYDLRLQVGGVLKSWAVPKGPSLDPKERRLAVEVEDHPLDYGGFEGVIPAGSYGAGPTLVWDRGSWAPMADIETSLKAGTLKFRLAGDKLKGGWTLARLKQREGEKQVSWLLIKENDDDAAAGTDILEERPESVLSGRLIEELLPSEPDRPPKRSQLRPGALKGARRAPLPKRLEPQLASPAAAPPEGDTWLHEIKFDGYRTIAIVEGGGVRLLTRNGLDWTARYGALAKGFAALAPAEAVIDGEVVVLDAEGVSRFGDLQNALAAGESWRLVFYAFDLVHLNGWDVSKVPLTSRKSLLGKLLVPQVNEKSALQLSSHVVGQGAAFLDRASELGLEGIVSKRAESPYQSGRTKTWLKSKAKQTGAFPVIGYTTSRAAGGLAALLLAEPNGRSLRYLGKVGTGFTASEAAALTARFEPHHRPKPPLAFDGPAPKAHWLEPRFKAHVHYSNKTHDNQLRHAVFKGVEGPQPEHAGAEPTKRTISDEQLARIWVTNPERRMFSRTGPTKLDLAVYYARVGDAMLPHILERPVSLVRCPSGKAEDCFFQRHAFTGMPAEIGTFVGRKSEEGDREYLVVRDAAGYLALAQFGVVEFHPWGCRTDKPERPDRMFFDLDPGEGVEWRDVLAAAAALKAELAALGLTPFVKTSGSKGLHVVVPLLRRYFWPQLHQASGAIAAAAAKKFPDTFVDTMAKERRKGRIFIDFHRNARSATAVAAYSLRTRPGLPASAPVEWRDLDAIDAPRDLNYATLPNLLSISGDPWARIDSHACSLDAAPMGKQSS